MTVDNYKYKEITSEYKREVDSGASAILTKKSIFKHFFQFLYEDEVTITYLYKKTKRKEKKNLTNKIVLQADNLKPKISKYIYISKTRYHFCSKKKLENYIYVTLC